MSKQREALKLALEAMDCIYSPLHVREINKVGAAMAAIREALAEPEQKLDSALEALQNEMRETISKLDPKEMVWIHQPPGMPPILCKEPVVGAVPLYTAPPTRKPLTDDEIKNALMVDPAPIYRLMTTGCIAGAELNEILKRVARAIERAHGIGSD